MFNFFRRSRQDGQEPAQALPSVGVGTRVYAIGDIHGCSDLFRTLVARVIEDAQVRGSTEELRVILLGDLVDRGPDSKGVIDLAIKLSSAWSKFSILMGNHEEVFLQALSGDPAAIRFFLRIGGRETLLSYGIDADLIDRDNEELLHAAMLRAIPESHRDFLAGLQHSIVVGDYLFVHAGIRPGVPLEEQKRSDFHWIRDEFLRHEDRHSHVVIHGHSIAQFVDEQPNRIGIDTGAYATGRLTAIGLEDTSRWYINT
jgi:serine/threonine protein phosphatase 1